MKINYFFYGKCIKSVFVCVFAEVYSEISVMFGTVSGCGFLQIQANTGGQPYHHHTLQQHHHYYCS